MTSLPPTAADTIRGEPAGAAMTDGWTIAEARAQFAETGLPIERLDRIIRALPGLKPCGETRPGERGGRGYALYPIRDLQRLHSALAPWLMPPSGDTEPPSPCKVT